MQRFPEGNSAGIEDESVGLDKPNFKFLDDLKPLSMIFFIIYNCPQ